MKYCSDDGKHIFDTQEEYDKYESEMLRIQKQKQAEREQQELQKKDIQDMWEKSVEIIKAYVNIYEELPLEPRNIYSLYKYTKDFKISERISDDETAKNLDETPEKGHLNCNSNSSCGSDCNADCSLDCKNSCNESGKSNNEPLETIWYEGLYFIF